MTILPEFGADKSCIKFTFYYATIAYHVGLNAVLGWPQGIRPTSKKKRHLCLAVASSCRHVITSDQSPYFLVGHVELVAVCKYTDIFIYFSAFTYCWRFFFWKFILLYNIDHSVKFLFLQDKYISCFRMF